MAFEVRELSGSLFKNGKREKDTQPNARGECKIGCSLSQSCGMSMPTQC